MTKDRALHRPSDEGLPPDVEDVLREVVQDSLIRYDVLRLFYANPYAILTISDLSVWIAREDRALANALQQLAAAGYLEQSLASSAFVLKSDREKRRRLEIFFDFLDAHPDITLRLRAQLRRAVEAEADE